MATDTRHASSNKQSAPETDGEKKESVQQKKGENSPSMRTKCKKTHYGSTNSNIQLRSITPHFDHHNSYEGYLLAYQYYSHTTNDYYFQQFYNPFTPEFTHDIGDPQQSAVSAADVIRPPGADPYGFQIPYGGAPSYPHPANDYYFQQLYGANPFSQQFMNVGTGNTVVDLETKKRKVIEGGAPADSVKVCTVCNVVCNSVKVFVSHLAGEKHALKARGILTGVPNPKVPPTHLKTGDFLQKTVPPAPKTAAKRSSQGLVGFAQSAYCDVCKLNCNSQEAFNNHKLGKKHLRNVQKLQESFAPKPANSPAKNLAQKDQLATPSTMEDLQIKTHKVLNGGAAADAVKICTLCNVVCNSETVFDYHIAGKKHLAMVNQQVQPAIN